MVKYGVKHLGMAKRPSFPGFERCLQMMRNSRGSVSEEGFAALAEQAAKYVPQLVAAFWDDDEPIHDWAARGLQHLDTKESRTALWRAGVAARTQD